MNINQDLSSISKTASRIGRMAQALLVHLQNKKPAGKAKKAKRAKKAKVATSKVSKVATSH